VRGRDVRIVGPAFPPLTPSASNEPRPQLTVAFGRECRCSTSSPLESPAPSKKLQRQRILSRCSVVVPAEAHDDARFARLHYLLLTAILTGCLWIPVVIGYVTTRGP